MKKEFRKWIKSENLLTDNSLNLYVSYLNIPSKLNIDDLEKIESFYTKGDVLYALSYCDKVVRCLDDMKNNTIHNKEIQNARAAYKMLALFLRTKKMKCTAGDKLDLSRKVISKNKLHKIDGIEGLTSNLGVKNFVKLAVEESFFFHPDIIKERHETLLDLFNKNELIPARKTIIEDENYSYSQRCVNGQWIFNESNLSIPIERDKDGNQNVRRIIKDYTGYSVCEGKDSIFQNYIISHIWGRAFDPRYFTSLWNIVLIPSWANSLMDKENPTPGSVESRLQNTFQAICKELYFKDISNWSTIKMQSQPPVNDSKDILRGDYILNIICEKTSPNRDSLVAPIIQESVQV